MNLIRKAPHNSLLLWLLAVTVGLRALIAPGFMLETNGDGPFGLAIVLCEGLNGSELSDNVNDPHALHKQHGNDSNNQDAANGLTGETCALWSTSSTFVETIAFVGNHLFPAGPDQFVPASNSIIAAYFRQQPQQPRAPPVSLII